MNNENIFNELSHMLKNFINGHDVNWEDYREKFTSEEEYKNIRKNIEEGRTISLGLFIRLCEIFDISFIIQRTESGNFSYLMEKE